MPAPTRSRLSARPAGRSGALAGLVAAGLALALPAGAGALGGVSAWPYATSSDSGMIAKSTFESAQDLWNRGPFLSSWYIRGIDPCVFATTLDTSRTVDGEVPQFAIPNCTPVISPWITAKPLATRRWELTCPTSAPYAWADSDVFRNVQLIAEVEGQAFVQGSTTMRWVSTNWTLKTRNWAWSTGCSTWKPPTINLQSPFDPTDYPSYAAGTPSISGSKLSPSVSGAGLNAHAPGVKLSLTSGVAASRGPKWRSVRTDSRTILRTVEIDLRPNRTRRHQVRCPRTHRVTYAHHGIGWYSTAPPPPSEAAKVQETVTRLPDGRGMQVRVRTGRIAPKMVRLQMSYGCRKLTG